MRGIHQPFAEHEIFGPAGQGVPAVCGGHVQVTGGANGDLVEELASEIPPR